MLFGEKLSLALSQRGLKPAEFSRRTKINITTLSRYLSNEREPVARNIIAMEDALGMERGEIWFLTFCAECI